MIKQNKQRGNATFLFYPDNNPMEIKKSVIAVAGESPVIKHQDKREACSSI